LDWRITRAILEKSPRFKNFLESVEENFQINSLWMYGYSPTTKDAKKPGGTFDWHRDTRYSGHFRMIVTIGSMNKIMFFCEKTEDGGRRVVGIRCENNSVVVLSHTSGGVSNIKLSHKVTNCENSFSLVLELTKRYGVKGMERRRGLLSSRLDKEDCHTF